MKAASVSWLLFCVSIGVVVPPLSAQVKPETVPLAIIVMDRTGAMVVKAQIRISPAPANFPKNAETDQTGKLSLEIPPGKYDVFIASLGFAPWGRCAEIRPGASHTIEVVLQFGETMAEVDTGGPRIPYDMNTAPPPYVSVVLEVTDDKGGVVSHARIGGLHHAGNSAFLETDEDGKAWASLPPGRRWIEVVSPGCQRWKRAIQIAKGTDGPIKVVLKPLDSRAEPCVNVKEEFSREAPR